MDLVATYNESADALVRLAQLPRGVLHVHLGMLIYLACQLVLGTRRGSLAAVAVTLALALFHEVMNRIFHGSWRWEDTRGDLVLSLFWPAMCYAVSVLRRRRWQARACAPALARPVRSRRMVQPATS
jgi:hypothetical protein